jgi:Na+/H+-dicarboxylate symporter
MDTTATAAESGTAGPPLSVAERAPQLIADIIPRSPETALVQQEMLGIVVFAILIGIACAVANPQRVEPFLKFLDALLEISMTVVKWAMFLAPWAVFGLIANLVAQVGLQTIYGMWAYIGTVIFGLLILYIVYLVIVAVLGGMNPFRFAGRIGGLQLLAFSTSSTAAVMPLSIDTAVNRLNVPESVANLVIPLCATINMAGTALYQAVAVIFLAQLSGVQLSVADYTMIVMTLVASSVGAPGTPGVGIVILSSIVGNFGIPAVGIPLILGVDRLLDMCRTTVNVTGDLAACVVLRRSGQTASLSPKAATESA